MGVKAMGIVTRGRAVGCGGISGIDATAIVTSGHADGHSRFFGRNTIIPVAEAGQPVMLGFQA